LQGELAGARGAEVDDDHRPDQRIDRILQLQQMRQRDGEGSREGGAHRQLERSDDRRGCHADEDTENVIR
jgi:hypothetical protein